MTNDIGQAKRRLRAELRLIRLREAAARPEAPLALREVFSRGAFSVSRKRVSAYLPLPGEMDPAPLTEALLAEGCLVCLPCVEVKGRPLLFRAYLPGDPLRACAYGLSEPLESQPLVEPDVLLVPLLGFDRAGRRLGQGAGFYDRTLASLRSKKEVVAIGLAFAAQEVAEVPCDSFDQRLDFIVTERGVILRGL